MGIKKEEKKRTGTDRIQDKTKMGSKKMRRRRGHEKCGKENIRKTQHMYTQGPG